MESMQVDSPANAVGIDRIIREAECERLTSLSRVTRWREEKKGKFPRRRKITDGGAVGWLESEITEWMRSRGKVA